MVVSLNATTVSASLAKMPAYLFPDTSLDSSFRLAP